MARDILFDITHVVSRLTVPNPTGIDMVDLAHARHWGGGEPRIAAGLHYGVPRPRIHAVERVQRIVRLAEAAWWQPVGTAEDPRLRALRAWLAGAPEPVASPTPACADARRSLSRRLTQSWLRAVGSRRMIPPEGAVYLNVAQHLFEFPAFFRWLERRPDLRTVFMVHDLLPLDYPEYFRPGYRDRFERRVQTIARHAQALLATSDAVARRVTAELESRGRSNVPVHVQPLPSPLLLAPRTPTESGLAGGPYFVAVGTVEPRKNHLLLLNIWRELALRGGAVPKLVLVGALGWECEQVVDLLTRCVAIAPHVRRVAALPAADLQRLVAGARALLMPSHDEGYGLPVAEALTLRTPVIASDIPVFREVSQGCAILIDPLDGRAWMEAIGALAGDPAAAARARQHADGYAAPTWPTYFRGVESFLAQL